MVIVLGLNIYLDPDKIFSVVVLGTWCPGVKPNVKGNRSLCDCLVFVCKRLYAFRMGIPVNRIFSNAWLSHKVTLSNFLRTHVREFVNIVV